MNKLLKFFNSLSQSERDAFCIAVRTTEGYLRKQVSKSGIFGAEICAQIELASNGEVTRKDLRPNDWHRIWPELAEKKAA